MTSDDLRRFFDHPTYYIKASEDCVILIENIILFNTYYIRQFLHYIHTYNVRFSGLFWTPLPILKSDVINRRSLVQMFVHFNHESLNDLLFAFVNPTKRSSFWLILALRTHLDFTQWAKKICNFFCKVILSAQHSKIN